MAPVAHIIKNTDKPYRCTSCGSDNVSIVREDAVNPRCKCSNCKFMFNGEDSLAAQDAGAIKPSSPEALAGAAEADIERLSPAQREHKGQAVPLEAKHGTWSIPTKPSYVFVARNRRQWEFTTKRDFKKAALRWSQGSPFDIYELKPVKLNVSVNIQ